MHDVFEHKDPQTNALDCCWLKIQRYYRNSITCSSKKELKKSYRSKRLVCQLNMASRDVGRRLMHIFCNWPHKPLNITAGGRVVISYCCWVSRDVMLYLLLQWSSYVAARRRKNIVRVRFRLSRATDNFLLVPIALSRWGAD